MWKTNFVLQQGLDAPPAESCSTTYSALQLQPRAVAAAVLGASLKQSPAAFASLAAVLWWSAILPRWNPFDATYNALFARSSGFRLQPAPPPRRFAQFLAGVFSIVIAALLAARMRRAAIVVECLFLVAIGALVFGGFCAGSYLFHLLRGRGEFANRTLPWSVRDE